LISIIFTFSPVRPENNFFSYISNVLNPKVLFKPSIDATTIFFKPEQTGKFLESRAHEVIKSKVQWVFQEGQFIHCCAPECEKRPELLEYIQWVLKVYKNDHFFGAMMFGGLGLACFAGAYSLFKDLFKKKIEKADDSNKRSLISSLNNSKLAIATGSLFYFFGFLFFLNLCAQRYVDGKVFSYSAELIEDSETFKNTISTLYDTVNSEKILNVFQKGMRQSF